MAKRIKIMLFLLALLIGVNAIPYHRLDPNLGDLNAEFIETVKENCDIDILNYPNKTIIGFDDLWKKNLADAIGVCYLSSAWWKISFDKTFWNSLDNDSKYALAMHEFSHCYLKEDHSVSKNNYMYSYMVPLTKELTKSQLIDNINKRCKEQKNE